MCHFDSTDIVTADLTVTIALFKGIEIDDRDIPHAAAHQTVEAKTAHAAYSQQKDLRIL
ncbi:hypothetical protein D3C81_2278590 [compost metagenome]